MYLSGVTSDRDEPTLIAAGIGLMIQPGNSYHLRASRYPAFAADNGCFNDRWVEDRWMRWLETLPRERCLFAVAPDVYGDAEATLERSVQYFDLIRELGFPVALVAQDGAERLRLPWDDFDALFVGGLMAQPSSTEWKVSAEAAELCGRARAAGKWVHMGRVNSLGRLKRARAMGCLSADGTRLKYQRRAAGGDPSLGGGINGWQRWLTANPPLPLDRHETPALPVHRDAL